MSSTSVLRNTARRRALSLVELLIVLVVLVVLGGLLIPVFTGVKERAEIAATTATMRQIQQAILGDGQSPGYFADMGELPRPCVYLSPQFICKGEQGLGDRLDHPQLRYLFLNPISEENEQVTIRRDLDWNPATQTGWRGPYLQQATGRYFLDSGRGFTLRYGDIKDPRTGVQGMADPALLDAWGNPIVIQEPASIGPGFDMKVYTRLVSAGPNGIIETDPDVLVPSENDRGDDIVIFLFGEGQT